MPCNPSSKRSPASRAQAAAARDEKEARVQLALAELEARQHKNISAAAAAHQVLWQTLVDRQKGRPAKKDTQESQEALPAKAEMALVEHIRRCAANCFPLNAAEVHNFAQGLASKEAASSSPVKLGVNWLTGFLIRHPDLKSCWSRCLENARVQSVEADGIKSFFDRLAEIVEEFRILPDNIFNMDETGFIFGQGGAQRVLVPNDGSKATRFKAQPGNRESATIIECIGSSGQILPSLVITKGKLHTVREHRRMEDIPAAWHFSKQSSGWTDDELAVLWAEKVFDANTRLLMPSAWRLLVLNGHHSHTSSKFIDALWTRNIVPLCFPAHCTHVMQPLDVSVFGRLTAAFRRLVTTYAPHVPGAGVDKTLFGSLYSQARAQTLTSAAARKAFQDSGITVRLDPAKVLNQIPGASSADRRSSADQLAVLQEAAVPRSDVAFNAMLGSYRDSKDPREARGLKRALSAAFHDSQAENAVLRAENSLLRAQEAQNAQIQGKARKKTVQGDHMVLSKDRMITREEAERYLAAKEPAIAKNQERARRRGEREAAADDNEEDDNNDEELLPSLPTPPPPPHTFLDDLDDGKPLSTIDNDDNDPFGFFETLPIASTSRTQL